MQFTNPIWLWALSGLAIPVGIHLLSRTEGKTMYIGSLRYLKDSPAARFRHLRLNEIGLLLLRCALLALIVFLLAGLTVNFNSEVRKWIVIEKGIENSEHYGPMIDSLEKHGFETRLLKPGFPLLKDSADNQQGLDYWGAAEKLRAMDLDSVIVVSYGYVNQFRGERISLPASISWFVDEPRADNFVAWKVSNNVDSVFTRTGHTSSTVTRFETKKEHAVPENKNTVADTVKISLFSDKEFTYDQKTLTATIDAIQTITPHTLIVSLKSKDELNPADSSWIIWLSHEAFPIDYKKSIAFAECSEETIPLLIEVDKDPVCATSVLRSGWAITHRLHEEIILKENFTIRLAAILLPEINNTLAAHDRRVLPEPMMWATTNKKDNFFVSKERNNTLQAIIMIVIFLTLVSERILAHQRNQ